MKKLTIATVMFTLLMLCSLSVFADPKAEVDNSTFDFGFAPQNAKLSHKYWIKSTGTEDLKILKVVPGCGCTKAPLEKNTISSGDSTWLEIIFSTKKYKSKISKSPKFFTNTIPDVHRISFTTQVVQPDEVTYPLVIEPFNLNLTGLKPDNESVRFSITNKSDQELTISIIDFAGDKFRTLLPEKIKAGEIIDGMVQLLSAGAEATFQKSLTIEVNDVKRTRYTIPVVYNANILTNK